MEAPKKASEIKAAITLVLGFLTGLWGYSGWAVALFIVSMAADYVTGTWAARAKGEWSSAAARQGLWHKLGEIAALLVAALCDIAGELADGHYLTLLVAIWYTFTELGSIIENAVKLGAPVPEWLKRGLALLRSKTDSGFSP